ncbi:MAG: hypothetical protein R2772_01320 [Chitinophagales bacterium]
MIKKMLAIFLVLLLCVSASFSQDSLKVKSFFKQRDFGKYFIADIQAPICNISLGYWTNSIEYNNGKNPSKSKYLPAAEFGLGTELPFLNWSKNLHQLSLSMPVHFQLWLNILGDNSAPVLNTDYRVGLELNYLYQSNKKFLKNIGLKFIPGMHESCHIGDEITIYRVQEQFPLTRVNVSYEAMDLALQVNDPKLENKENISFKIGAKVLYSPKSGWYSISTKDGDTTKISPSKRWIEPYIQIQYQKVKGFPASKKLMFVASLDSRLLVKYSYPTYTKENGQLVEHANKEAYAPSLNFLVGYKYNDLSKFVSKFGFYFRGYYGLNYHGQFRNQNQFSFLGLSFVFEN